MVTRLDRLARSTRDLLNVLHEVAQSSAAFKSLHDHWADTTTPHGRLMLTILGGLAEFERSLIKARTDVGIKRAREAGIRFGRPPKLTRHQQEQALKLLDQGEPQSAVARLLNVDQSTISHAWGPAWRPKMEIICDGRPGQIRPGILRGMGCAVVATPRDASKQGGQDRVRTLSLAVAAGEAAIGGAGTDGRHRTLRRTRAGLARQPL
jgi:hypothetical protein